MKKTTPTDEHFMSIAIEESKKGDGPYGAVIVKGGKIIAQTHNTGKRDTDSTAHAEVNAIRLAQKTLGTTKLIGCTLYSSAESCPMCTAAEIWAKLDRVVFGCSIEQLMEVGSNQIELKAQTIIDQGFHPMELVGDILADEAIEVVKNFKKVN